MLNPVSENIRVFIGYDECETVAYHVLSNSINRLSTNPVSITPIKSDQLNSIYWRERDPKQSNDFSFTRFLVPWLCNYEGWAIFMDCDMLCRTDISKLWNLRDCHKAIQVVKHHYVPKDEIKYLGNTQYTYNRKNWSSLIMFNNKRCKDLTPEYINNSSGLELHQFKWLEDSMIGSIPHSWNHLVGEYDYDEGADIVHFTVGGPYFEEYKDCDYADEWFRERDLESHCEQRIDTKIKVSER